MIVVLNAINMKCSSVNMVHNSTCGILRMWAASIVHQMLGLRSHSLAFLPGSPSKWLMSLGEGFLELGDFFVVVLLCVMCADKSSWCLLADSHSSLLCCWCCWIWRLSAPSESLPCKRLQRSPVQHMNCEDPCQHNAHTAGCRQLERVGGRNHGGFSSSQRI